MMKRVRPFHAIDIISKLGWALGYFGMPHILVRFMAISSEKEVKKSRVIGCVWCAISLCFACFIAIVGRAYLVPALANNKSENVFIEMIQKVFNSDIGLPFSRRNFPLRNTGCHNVNS